jgi:membrane protein DedA with SNARE-associated domain
MYLGIMIDLSAAHHQYLFHSITFLLSLISLPLLLLQVFAGAVVGCSVAYFMGKSV